MTLSTNSSSSGHSRDNNNMCGIEGKHDSDDGRDNDVIYVELKCDLANKYTNKIIIVVAIAS